MKGEKKTKGNSTVFISNMQKTAEGKQNMNKHSSFISHHSSFERKLLFTLIPAVLN